MVNTKMFEFKHPKYYKELRDAGNELAKRNAVKEDLASSGSSPARNKSDQAISSGDVITGDSTESQSVRRIRAFHQPQAASNKPQAPSFKRQAQIKNYNRRQAPSNKHQASSHKRQAP